MVTLPPLSEGAYSQLRAALDERHARLSSLMARMGPSVSKETEDYLVSSIFWLNDAIQTTADAEEFIEPDPRQMAMWTTGSVTAA